MQMVFVALLVVEIVLTTCLTLWGVVSLLVEIVLIALFKI